MQYLYIHLHIVGGRNPYSVESSFDGKLSGKQIKNVTIWYPKYESLVYLKKEHDFHMSGDIQMEGSISL
jgi:hypothetical protein